MTAEQKEKAATWLILPVVICLSQGLSHARLSRSSRLRASETANGSVQQFQFTGRSEETELDNCGNSRANTCTRARTLSSRGPGMFGLGRFHQSPLGGSGERAQLLAESRPGLTIARFPIGEPKENLADREVAPTPPLFGAAGGGSGSPRRVSHASASSALDGGLHVHHGAYG